LKGAVGSYSSGASGFRKRLRFFLSPSCQDCSQKACVALSWTLKPSAAGGGVGVELAAGGLPPAVYELGARVLTPRHSAHGLPPRVRLRARSGRWSVMEGAPLEGGEPGRVAVTIRSATGDEVFDVLSKAHGLTPRERQLATLVRAGLATGELARALRISPYTVQDHLKAIFDKTGVRSRRDLVGKVFFAHYEPRLRDNERRTCADLPVRGGPVDSGRRGQSL